MKTIWHMLDLWLEFKKILAEKPKGIVGRPNIPYRKVDARGIPLAVKINVNVHDMKIALETIDSIIIDKPNTKQNICMDKGYDYKDIDKW